MDNIDLPKDLIIRDYQEEDYDELINFWYLTDMGNPERAIPGKLLTGHYN